MIPITIKSDVGEIILEAQAVAEDIPEMLENDFAEDAINIMTEIPRNYIPAMHRKAPQQTSNRATGRLWSGWGRRRNVHTTNPASTLDDNIAEIDTSGDSVEISVGTRVRYAGYVDIGAPMGQGRPAYMFSLAGNAQIEMELERAIEYYTDKLIDDRMRTGASLRARGRLRDVAGRFLPN